MPTRDEIKKEIADAIDAQFPENEELDGDDLDTIESEVEKVCSEATAAMDSADEDEDEEEETKK